MKNNMHIYYSGNCAERRETNFIYAHAKKISHLGKCRSGPDFSLLSYDRDRLLRRQRRSI